MSKTSYNLAGKRIWVAGHRGMVGSAIVRRLAKENPQEILTASRQDLDLCDSSAVRAWIQENIPDAIFLAAAKVGGIYANDTYPADFLYENMMIAANIINAAHSFNIEKLIFLGSSCIYPKFAEQPIVESSLLTGELEPTNEWYAIAKIAGIKLCQAYRRQYGRDFISAMPTNLYGPGDNYHPQNSHVIPALLRKAHIAKNEGAKSLEIWGSGTAMREFLHVDDCADAVVFLMKNYSDYEHVNVGSGVDMTIADLAQKVMNTVGFSGNLTKDASKPDGTPRKLMSAAKIKALGWTPKISIDEGLHDAYQWYCDNQDL